MKMFNYRNLPLEELGKFQDIDPAVLEKVTAIIEQVKKSGDLALRQLTFKYDACSLSSIKVDLKGELKNCARLSPELKKALARAIKNLRRVARRQIKGLKGVSQYRIETQPGVIVEQKLKPIKRAGIYVPGGRYPLISSLYMAAIPALEAGVEEIIVCTPPDKTGKIRPEIIFLADLLGIKEVYRIGGAQAIAAMALGTETIKQVDKIVGPGNLYVTAAKKLLYGKVDIDFIAGPTELLIIADSSARADLVAADLLAQAEHDVLARPILVSLSKKLALEVKKELEVQLKQLPDPGVAAGAMRNNCLIIICSKPHQACSLANRIAPEHLSLVVENPEKYAGHLTNYGCLFLGQNSAEVFGDYCAGSNHILPTNGASRYTGGLNCVDFLKFVSQIKIEDRAVKTLARTAALLARTEGLEAHARSAERRQPDQKSQI